MSVQAAKNKARLGFKFFHMASNR